MSDPVNRPTSAVERPAPRRAKHLMDPANPRLDRPNSASITRVQTWVMSSLAVTTILHLSLGLLLSAAVIDPDMLVERVGLTVIAGAFGVVAVAAGLAIHQRPIASPWLAVGLAPALVGAALIFGL